MYINSFHGGRSPIRIRGASIRASVAIVIAARNAADTIPATLDSLIEQSFTDWEAIVVNDGSTDATGHIAEEYARRDARLRVMHARHGGVSAARNAGFEATRAPWIMLLDADDQLQPWHLEGMMATARDDASADAIHSDWRIIGANGEEGARQKVQFPGPPILKLSRSACFVVHGLMFRRDLLERTGPFQTGLPIGEDWDLWLRMARIGARFRPARSDVVARYTIRPGSACSNPLEGVGGIAQIGRLATVDDPRIRTRVEPPSFGPGELEATNLHNAIWMATRHAGNGGDARAILDQLRPAQGAAVSEPLIKWTIFNTVQQAFADPRPDWPAIWPGLRPRIAAMLDHVAPQTRMPLFSEQLLKGAEHLAIAQLDPATLAQGHARQVGRWLLARVDLARSELPPLPEGADFARVQIDRDGVALGEVIVYAERLSTPDRFAAIAASFANIGPPDPADVALGKAALEQPAPLNRLAGCRASASDAAEIAGALWRTAGGRAMRALVVAAGDGRLAEALASVGAEVRATESDPLQMRALRLRHLRTRGLWIGMLDPLRDPLEGSYDLVVLPRGMLGLTEDETRTILVDRLWTVVAPGGRLAVVASGDEDDGTEIDADAVRLLLRERFALCPTMRRVGRRELIVAERHRQGEEPVSAPYLALPLRSWRPEGVPVLMYHRVANDPVPGLEHYAVTPAEFATQMDCLASMGATAVTLDQFDSFLWEGASLPERPVLITFDDAYVDTLTEAIPVMRRSGMTATIFVPTAHVGGTSAWDAAYGPCAPLMDWDQLRLVRDLGFSLAAHSHNHLPMAALDHAAFCRELDRPRELLRQELGIETRALAYPYGSVDQAVEWEVHSQGYRLAFSTESRRFSRREKVMSIPRLDVPRGLCLDRFARMVTG